MLQLLIKKHYVRGATVSKISLFRLKITVGCLTSTYPSIRVERVSQDPVGASSWEHISEHSLFFCLTLDTLKFTVGCQCGWLCCGGLCVLALWWCVCAQLWLKLEHRSLSLSCSRSPMPLQLSQGFFTLILFLSSFSLAPSLTLAGGLVLSLGLFFGSFFPSTHSSLLFPSRQQTVLKSI